MENLDPPPPPAQIKDAKMARFWPSRGFILDLGGIGIQHKLYYQIKVNLIYNIIY